MPDLTPHPLGDPAPILGGRDLAVAVADGTLRATVWDGSGPVDGRPGTVLLHGLAQQRHFWRPVVRRLGGIAVATLDQRGHGDTGGSGPYDMGTLADDVAALLDGLGWGRAVVVGHSWGAAVALATAARHPDRVAAVVAVDGGTTSPPEPGQRAAERRRLEPPRLGVEPGQLRALLASGALKASWSDEVEDALLPTFELGADGLVRTRIGFDRHMQVLDGLLDVDPADVLAAIDCPAWIVLCSPPPSSSVAADEATQAWQRARAAGRDQALRLLARPRVMEWVGAIHDVPLQWPALVAGLIRSAGDEVAGSASGAAVSPRTGARDGGDA